MKKWNYKHNKQYNFTFFYPSTPFLLLCLFLPSFISLTYLLISAASFFLLSLLLPFFLYLSYFLPSFMHHFLPSFISPTSFLPLSLQLPSFFYPSHLLSCFILLISSSLSVLLPSVIPLISFAYSPMLTFPTSNAPPSTCHSPSSTGHPFPSSSISSVYFSLS